MAVYVDNMVDYSYAGYKGNGKWCHMTADTLDELHAMAEKIGLKRGWFQDNIGHPHYDLRASKRKLAIQYGALEGVSESVIHRPKK